jgi:hypothetical protein
MHHMSQHDDKDRQLGAQPLDLLAQTGYDQNIVSVNVNVLEDTATTVRTAAMDAPRGVAGIGTHLFG